MSKLVKARVQNFRFKSGKYEGCKLEDIAEDKRGRKYLQTIIDNKEEEIEVLRYALDKKKGKIKDTEKTEVSENEDQDPGW